MKAAAVLNITTHAGDTEILEQTVVDGISPVDLTASEILYRLSKGVGSMTLISKATGDGIEITDPDSGVFQVEIAEGETDGLEGNYRHTAQLIEAGGRTTTVLTGVVTILPRTAV